MRERRNWASSRPSIGEEEIEAVAETLRSGWLTTGPRAALLEERMAEYLEAKHVLAVASGTAALHLALVALGIGPGDEVITTPITWPATANVIVHTGADARLRRRARGRPQHRPGARRGRGDRADEGDHARAPRRPALRPRPDLGARHPRDRGRRARGRERLPRPQARRALRGDLLLALRDEEHRRGRGRPHLHERRRRRRGDPQPAADAPRRRLALRHHRARLQGEPLRRARRDRARPARQAPRAHRRARAPVRALRRGDRAASTGSSRSRATRATRTRAISTSSGSTPSASA